MKKEDQQMLEKIFDTERIGCACLYPNDGSAVQESVIAATPENLAAYVGSHLRDAEKMVVTDMCGRLILDTCGGFIKNCPDQNLCMEINTYLSPLQVGDREAGKVLIVSRKAAEEYFALEDEAVGMAAYGMI